MNKHNMRIGIGDSKRSKKMTSGLLSSAKSFTRKLLSRGKTQIARSFFVFTPKYGKIVVNNFNGKGYGGNPKYIIESLRKRSLDGLRIFWLVQDYNVALPPDIHPVKAGSLLAEYHFSTAKVWLSNVRLNNRSRKKKTQFYVQTWHAMHGIKYAEKDIQDSLDPAYVQHAIRDSHSANLFVSSGSTQTKEYRDSFWYTGEILESGYPRTDILISGSDPQKKMEIYDEFRLDNQKIALYIPTFRDSGESKTMFENEYEDIVTALEKRFDENFVLFVRFHPNVKGYKDWMKFSDRIIDATEYPDLQELMRFSSVLITDYSSAVFDYMLMKKPVFIFAMDLSTFEEENRRLRLHPRDLPFPFSTSIEELVSCILSYSVQNELERSESFFARYEFIADGLSSKVVADRIERELFPLQ